MYHSVGVPNPNWIWNFLTTPHKIFEDHLRVLKRKGFNTIDFNELYEYVGKGKVIPQNSVVLSFDDGYLDNWVYAYPLLKKYGFRGTIFVNPEFVDPTEECRPNLEVVWAGKIKEEELGSYGFLSWREMAQMEKEGVMDIESHAMTHTWYFCGPDIIDFRHPGDEYVWMGWNEFPDEKYLYLTKDQNNVIKWGAPVYSYGKSLESFRYFPDEKLKDFVIEYVKENGGKAFFDKQDWKETLFKVSKDYKEKYGDRGRSETQEGYYKRIEDELRLSKQIIERMLNKAVNFLCWPGGSYNDLSLSLSKKYYIATTLSSRDTSLKQNIWGEDPSRIRRIGIPTIGHINKESFRYLGGFYLYLYLKKYQESYVHNFIRKAIKLYDHVKPYV